MLEALLAMSRERAQREPRVSLKIIGKTLPPANCLAASRDPQRKKRHQDWKADLYTHRKPFANCVCVIVVVVVVVVRVTLSRP